MTITTYSELQTTIASWAHNTALTTQIPDFITLAEAAFNRILRLRTMESDNALTLTSGARTVSIPSGYIEPISLRLIISGEPYRVLTPRMPQELNINVASTAARRPEYWTINGTNIEFPNLADQTYSLTLRMVTAFSLSNASPTNWLLTNHPDLYLYGSMLQAAPYMVNDSRIPTWKLFYDAALKQVKDNAARSRSIASLITDLPTSRRGLYNVYTDE
jgi:hypothetical protein